MVLYNEIGLNYDTTRKADLEITGRLFNNLQLKPAAQVLDVGCGTGNYTVALKKMGLEMTGVDISAVMIDQAMEKDSNLSWLVSDASKLPFKEPLFDGAMSVLAIHHFTNLQNVFQDVYRVIKKGRFVIFTSTPEQMRNYWLNEYFPQVMNASIKQMPSAELVTTNLINAGFRIIGLETFLVQPNLGDFFLYSGKYQPNMYLDRKVRAGISSFASLVNEKYVTEGCNKLKEDIASGKIKKVLSKHSSYRGDYIFIVAEK